MIPWLSVKDFFVIFLTQMECLELSQHLGVELTLLNLLLHFCPGMVIVYGQLTTMKGIGGLAQVVKKMVVVLLKREFLNLFYPLGVASVGDLLHLHSL